MAATTSKQIRVSKILQRVFKPVEKHLTPEAAQAFLRMKFEKEDIQRMHELAEKASAGKLSEFDNWEAEMYQCLGSMLGIIQSKARRRLKNKTS